jgi:hypothetical protein
MEKEDKEHMSPLSFKKSIPSSQALKIYGDSWWHRPTSSSFACKTCMTFAEMLIHRFSTLFHAIAALRR